MRRDSAIDRWALPLAVFIATLALLWCCWHKFRTPALLEHRFIGSEDYTTIAESWVAGNVLQSWRPPLYALLIAPLIAWLGPNDYLPGLAFIHLFMFVLLLLAMWKLGSVAGGKPRWGLLAVLLTAANLRLGLELLAKRETALFACWLICILWIIMARRDGNSSYSLLLGILCGAAWLTRPTGVLIAPSLCIAWSLCHADSTRHLVHRRLLPLLLGLALPMGAWLGYQHTTGQRLHLSGDAAWENLYRSFNSAMPVYYPYLHMNAIEGHMRALRRDWQRTGLSNDEGFIREAMRFVRQHPIAAVKLVPIKAAVFFWPGYIPFGRGTLTRTKDDGWRIDHYRPFRWHRQLAGFAAVPALLLFFFGLTKIRQLPMTAVFVLVLVSVTALLHTALYALTRYRLPFDPLLTIAGILIIKHCKPRWFAIIDDC